MVDRIDRRQFIKYLGGLVGAIFLSRYGPQSVVALAAGEAAGGAAPQTARRVADGIGTVADASQHFNLVIDVGACIGCRRCQWACKEENNTPDSISPPWIEVFEMKQEMSVTGEPSLEDLRRGDTTSYTDSPREGRWYLPAQCNHCDNPPCVKVCPTGATYKDKDGLVLVDYERCIGCRFCVVACPYSARRFNWLVPQVPPEKVNPLVPLRPVGVVEKCTFCVHRVRRGKLPRCVEVCPVGARHFGDINDPESEVSKLLRSNLSFRLLEALNTKPQIAYITRGKKFIGKA